MKTQLNNTEHGYEDYDVKDCGDIYRACVVPNANSIKNGDVFNIYRGEGRKDGCTWKNDLQQSLVQFLVDEYNDQQKLKIKFDAVTQEYRVGNYFQFKAFEESGEKKNLMKVCSSQQEAEDFIKWNIQNEKDLNEELGRLEHLHP